MRKLFSKLKLAEITDSTEENSVTAATYSHITELQFFLSFSLILSCPNQIHLLLGGGIRS